MYPKLKLFTLSVAILVATATASHGLDEVLPAEDPAVAAPAEPQLPFEIPELSETESDSIAPGPASSFARPQASLGLPGAPTQGAPSGSMIGATDEDIRAIRGPISIPAPIRWAWVALAALILTTVLAVAWVLYRRHSSIRVRLAYEIAFEQLERARSLMQPEQAREFSIMVSEAMRSYIDQRFGLGATHCTTEEFLRSLATEQNNPLQGHTEPLRDFLGHCALAKFAGFVLAVPQMEAMHASAWRLVDETRPRPEDNLTEKTADRETSLATADRVPALAVGGAS